MTINPKITSIIIIAILFTQAIGFAQNEKAMTFSIIKESTKLPTSRAFKSPFHPGIEMGYEYFLGNKKKHQFSLSFKIGYHFHKDLRHGITVKPAINYYYVTNINFYLGTELNLGYLHSFINKPIFKQNTNGEYQRIKNFGKSKFMPSLAFSSGYQFHRQDKNHLDFFIKYEFGIETPFAKGIGIPVFPHSLIHLGTRWYAFK